jgi:hypothetical protein
VIIDINTQIVDMAEKTKIIKVEVPESVHTDFKIMCAATHENMKDRARKLVEDDIARWRGTSEQGGNREQGSYSERP